MNYSQIAVIDFETTGLNPQTDYPIEVAVGIYKKSPLGYIKTKRYQQLIKLPEGVEVPQYITDLTGLTTEKLNTEGIESYIVITFLNDMFTDDTLFVAHNANFDLGFLAKHFRIEVDNFLCTRTVEVLLNPHMSASLKDAYKRYYPESTGEQTHRAQDDIEMTYELLCGQLQRLSEGEVDFFINKMVNMPDRDIKYYPPSATTLDFTINYVSRTSYDALQNQLWEAQQRIAELESSAPAEPTEPTIEVTE
ncbi:DnaQ-like exonuclease [Bacillus phage 056SW001B]|uniref:DnaQ-like exonuclease n=1 Tax=Bacillus phage 056SW001B TaxID=2601663 RepID=A0A5P8PIL9_9CAUD|nr:DnaQ-like exonuclease [Bacillus phage 056SW001B]